MEAGDEFEVETDPDKIEEMKKKVNEAIRAVAEGEVRKAIEGMNVSGDNALSKLEKSLESISKRESLGEKKGEEVRDFLLETIQQIADGLGSAPDDVVKKMVCARLLVKLKTKSN